MIFSHLESVPCLEAGAEITMGTRRDRTKNLLVLVLNQPIELVRFLVPTVEAVAPRLHTSLATLHSKNDYSSMKKNTSFKMIRLEYIRTYTQLSLIALLLAFSLLEL